MERAGREQTAAMTPIASWLCVCVCVGRGPSMTLGLLVILFEKPLTSLGDSENVLLLQALMCVCVRVCVWGKSCYSNWDVSSCKLIPVHPLTALNHLHTPSCNMTSALRRLIDVFLNTRWNIPQHFLNNLTLTFKKKITFHWKKLDCCTPCVEFPSDQEAVKQDVTFDLCILTFLCDHSTQLPHSIVPQEPPLTLHPHLALRVVLLWDLRPERKKTNKKSWDFDLNFRSRTKV